jgi:hypothetical protein
MAAAVTMAVTVPATTEVQVDTRTIAVVAVVIVVACHGAAAVTSAVLVPASPVRHRFSG